MGDPIDQRAAGPHARPASAADTSRGIRGEGSRSPADAFTLDLQTLLSHAVVRLRDATSLSNAVAWALRDDGTPYVVAASFDAEPPGVPSIADFAALSTLEGVSRLDASSPLGEIAERHGLSASAPIRGAGRQPLAVLSVGPESARPRVLASLGETARRLEVPLAAAMAAGRFRELDRDVRRIDRLAALGALTAEIAHEVRNPLTSIKTFLQLLPERGSDPEFNENFLELVQEELRRMERLLDGIIEHAQPSRTPDADGASLGDAIESALCLVRHRCDKQGIDLRCADLADLPMLSIDADGLRQVVLNLILNAIEASPAGSVVHVTAATDVDTVTFWITDEGSGVSPELRGEIFAVFFSTRNERSGGLGLAITRRIIDDAGGSIEVGDGASGGAEFTVRIPRARLSANR